MANVSCISQLEDGSIWFGTDGAGLVKYDGYYFHEEYSVKEDNNHHVTSIIEEKDVIYFTYVFCLAF